MLFFRSAGIYTLANGAMALVGLAMTLALGHKLGPDGFGVWASFFAAQNIWAGLGFMRLETRLASCASIYQANRIIYAGFYVGLLVSTTLALLLVLIMGTASNIWLAVLSGFGLSVFDVISQRKAYEGRHLDVLYARCSRSLLPLFIPLMAALAGASVPEVINWHGSLGIIIPLVVWGRWIANRLCWRLCISILRQYQNGLLPSLIMSLLNGVWINGLTPMLNHFATSALAGQFAMIQRVVGGTLGLLSSAISLSMLKRNFVRIYWPTVSKVLTTNLIISVSLCMLLAIPLVSESRSWLGFGWVIDPSIYLAACAFLVSSFAIGAISVIAIRLHDEWFLTFWQLAALLSWALIYMMTPPEDFAIPALWVGAAMYMLLGLRWRNLATTRKRE